VELEEERGRMTVRSSGTLPLPGSGETAVTEAVRALAAQHRWKGREVVVSLPRAEAALRWLTLPASPREDTAGMVELEAAHSLPFPVEEAAWDFLSYPSDGGQQEVLLVAARRALVQQQRRSVEAAGLKVAAVSVDVLAGAALYQLALPETTEGAVLLHVEEGAATLAWVHDGRVLVSRSVAAQGEWTAEALAAEVRRTLIAGAMTGGGAQASSAAARLLEARAVWLTGEGAEEGLAREMARALQPPARTEASPSSSPQPGVQVALLPRASLPGGTDLSPALDVALGLALTGLRSPLERLDLARAARAAAETGRSDPARRAPLLAGAAVAAAAVLLVVLAGPGAGNRELAATASRAQTDARRLATRRTEMEGRVRQLAGAVAPEHSYLDVLNDVSALAGSEAWLTQFTYDRGRPIVIRGSARSNAAVARLVDGLRRSRHLDRVTLGSVTRSETDEMSLIQFSISGSLRDDAPLEPRRRRTTRSSRSGA
jgi:Tfp pilus assembly protein PilN